MSERQRRPRFEAELLAKVADLERQLREAKATIEIAKAENQPEERGELPQGRLEQGAKE